MLSKLSCAFIVSVNQLGRYVLSLLQHIIRHHVLHTQTSRRFGYPVLRVTQSGILSGRQDLLGLHELPSQFQIVAAFYDFLAQPAMCKVHVFLLGVPNAGSLLHMTDFFILYTHQSLSHTHRSLVYLAPESTTVWPLGTCVLHQTSNLIDHWVFQNKSHGINWIQVSYLWSFWQKSNVEISLNSKYKNVNFSQRFVQQQLPLHDITYWFLACIWHVKHKLIPLLTVVCVLHVQNFSQHVLVYCILICSLDLSTTIFQQPVHNFGTAYKF